LFIELRKKAALKLPFLLFVFCAIFKQHNNMTGNNMKKIALIIGHSEDSQGAENKSSGMSEYMFNEPLAMLIAEQLNLSGFEPITIYRDCSYLQLPIKVNNLTPDIAISLHCNAFNKKQNGTETLHYIKSQNGKRLAGLLQNEIVNCLGLPDRGLKPCQAKHKGKAGDRGGHLLKYTNMPCVITEPFFIDCDKSLELANGKLNELAQAFSRAIIRYFEV